jgi:hypothetical protein
MDKQREAWENGGRAEVLNWFRTNVYGINPIGRPGDMEIGENCVTMAGGKLKIRIHVSLPEGASAENPVPVFIFGDHSNFYNVYPFREKIYAGIPTNSITARGYAYVTFNFNDVCPNTMRGKYLDEWKKGVYQIYGGANRTATSWGTIAAWAWGFSRVMDWVETRPELDAKRVAVVGHSRGGKTALWAAAQDERIALGISNNSGCGGAAIFRGKKGEHVKNINVTDWFCENFQNYNDREEFLPVDQHMVLSLVAPRYLYVTDSILDEWADPDAELLACQLATTAYELYGLKGLVLSDPSPVLNKAYRTGHIAFHVKEGDHSQLEFDWNNLMDYFDDIIAGKI